MRLSDTKIWAAVTPLRRGVGQLYVKRDRYREMFSETLVQASCLWDGYDLRCLGVTVKEFPRVRLSYRCEAYS